MAEQHPERKQFVRNVRQESQEKARLKREEEEMSKFKVKVDKPPADVEAKPLLYLPYKCGLCDFAAEKEEVIRAHCREVHGLTTRFKCAHCQKTDEDRKVLENHVKDSHDFMPNHEVSVIRAFYVEQHDNSGLDEERRLPLWRRDMPGVRHIRGILYDDSEYVSAPYSAPMASKKKGVKKTAAVAATTTLLVPSAEPAFKMDDKGLEDEADILTIKCKECDISKKSVKALKMHIKLLHLRTGKFRYV